MRALDRGRLRESGDHAVIERPWELDVVEVNCSWLGGNDGLCLEVVLSKPFQNETTRLKFTGVFDLRLDGFRPLNGLRILDTREFRPEIPAPVCVIHYRGPESEDAEPYFWAHSVEVSDEKGASHERGQA
jgi:hypothetical protein